jgi:hypothetical protein
MPTEFLTAVGSEGIALFYREDSTGESLLSFLQGKGYRMYVARDPRQLIDLGLSKQVQLAVVQLVDLDDATTIMRALHAGDSPPPVIGLCEPALRTTLMERLAPQDRPDALMHRPVPFARLLGEIENQLSDRVGAKASGQQPAISFAQLLAHLWSEQRTGRLQVTVNGVQTGIYLRDGLPVFAEQGSLEDTLGRMLVRTGRITHDDFSRAVKLITDRMVDDEQMRLGEALIELQVLTAEQIHDALRDQVRQKILACFRAQRFHSDFRAGADLLEPIGEFPSAMESLMSEGLRTVDPQRLDTLLRAYADRFPTLARPPAEIAEAFALSRQEQVFIGEIDGDSTVTAGAR